MEIDLFRRITREMREAGVEEIGVFYIGESFMSPDLLIEAVYYLKHDLQMPYVFLTSNGSLASPKAVAEVMRAGLDSLKWSVNAATPDQFREMMEVSPRMHEKALSNIREAWSVREVLGAKTHLYASSIMYDRNTPEQMKEMLDERVLPYVDQHYWLPLYSMGSWATSREEELGYRPTAGNQGRIGALRDPLPCWAVFTEGHVTSTGVLSACCFDADDRWNMGNLNTMSFMDAWNSPTFQELRRAHLAKDVSGTECAKCIAYQGQ